VVDRVDYARSGSGDRMLLGVRSSCVRLTAAREGCLVLIKWPGTPDPSHIGFFSKGNLLHCYERAGAVLEHGYRAPWTRMTYGMFDMAGLE
jgi:hypothetical protein